MVYMNVFFVHAAQHHAHRIGGILRNILDLLFLCKVTDGWLTPVMKRRPSERVHSTTV